MDYNQITKMGIQPGNTVRVTRQISGLPTQTTIVYYSHVEDGSLEMQRLYFARELINGKLPVDAPLDYFYARSIIALELL